MRHDIKKERRWLRDFLSKSEATRKMVKTQREMYGTLRKDKCEETEAKGE